jgi:molybdopterin synthase sulfur carrier subunit
MSVKVRIPSPLRKITGGLAEVDANGSNIDEVISDLTGNYPDLRERICDESGTIRRFINVYLNDEDIRFLDNKSTAVKAGDEVSIVPAIAGGQGEVTRKIYLTFPENLIKQPLIYQVGQKYKVVTNIRSASITDKVGIVALELTGENSEIESAINFFKEGGVTVEPIELNVIE